MSSGNEIHTQGPISFTSAHIISVRHKPGHSAETRRGTWAWHLPPGPASPAPTTETQRGLHPSSKTWGHTGPLRWAIRRQ